MVISALPPGSSSLYARPPERETLPASSHSAGGATTDPEPRPEPCRIHRDFRSLPAMSPPNRRMDYDHDPNFSTAHFIRHKPLIGGNKVFEHIVSVSLTLKRPAFIISTRIPAQGGQRIRCQCDESCQARSSSLICFMGLSFIRALQTQLSATFQRALRFIHLLLFLFRYP